MEDGGKVPWVVKLDGFLVIMSFLLVSQFYVLSRNESKISNDFCFKAGEDVREEPAENESIGGFYRNTVRLGKTQKIVE